MSKKRKKQSANTVTRYKLVVDEYYNNGCDGVAAYMAIYTKGKKPSAGVAFNRIKNDPRLQDYIKGKQEIAARKIDMTHTGILQELKNFVEADVTEFLGLTIDEIKRLPIELRRFMRGHKQTSRDIYDSKGKKKETITTITMSFESKAAFIEMINKMIGAYKEDNKQKAATVDLSSQTTSELLLRAAAIKALKNG